MKPAFALLKNPRLIAGVALLVSLAAGRPTAAAVPDGPSGDTPPPPEVGAASAMLIDAVTGTVLWEKNANQRRPMASTTKIMTAALLIERARMTDMVPISAHALQTPYAGLNAKPGEQIGMEDLLYAIMLRSANDGCVAAAEHVAGSEAAFVGWMNDKAQQLGALDTHFVTTNGLYDPQHYTTAADLARIARYAVRYTLFNEIVAATTHRITTRTINQNDTLLENHNHFLSRYAGADGIKTGFVRQSGKCLVASASHPEGSYPRRLIAVVLNAPKIYEDSSALLDYGFKNFQPVFLARRGEAVGSADVAGGDPSRVSLAAASDLFAVLPRGARAATETQISVARNLRAPLRADRELGTLRGFVNGRPLEMSVALVPARAVAVSWNARASWWGGWCLLVMMLFGLGPRYARAVTESSRRRRRLLPAGGGSTDCQRAGECEWNRRTGTGE